METLQAKTRDMSVKAKKLRKQGMLTASISGRDMEHSLSLTLNQNEVTQFMHSHMVGSTVAIVVDGKDEYKTVIKSVDYNTLGHSYIDMTFQQLVADEKIKSQAVIEYANEGMVQGFINRGISEIEYEAYPKDLFDKVVVDVSKYKIGDNVKVGDLEIAKNSDIDLITPEEESVLHILAQQHMSAEDEEMIEEAEEAAAAE